MRDQAEYRRKYPERQKLYQRRYYLKLRADGRRLMFKGLRSHAKTKGAIFTIKVDDLVIPEFCPILGVRLAPVGDPPSDASPTVDRLIPSLGYVPGNVAVISMRANRLKNDARVEELERIAAWMRARLAER